jgi:hypothetical protein
VGAAVQLVRLLNGAYGDAARAGITDIMAAGACVKIFVQAHAHFLQKLPAAEHSEITRGEGRVGPLECLLDVADATFAISSQIAAVKATAAASTKAFAPAS